ncbi:hypothetical protein CHS0354_001061 [Potamilus streckersoni]|uniref:Uncharacterized protein n=1 Tax=Potamilus streckersoni TaxID=2493646 RepID=A0AAE0SV24_9BIVA|nr:hypothetical protein CHS0354_001061 [Potamilus streckersoni]
MEYNGYIKKQPGEVYSPNEQCHVTIGPNSVLCEVDGPLKFSCKIVHELVALDLCMGWDFMLKLHDS